MIERKSTKRIIAESFIELVTQKNVREVTIADIASNCGISERTFYYHFHDKFELIEEVYAKQLDASLEHWGEYGQVLRKSAEFIDEFAVYIVKAMAEMPGIEPIIDRMARRSSQMYIDRIATHIGKESVTDEMVFQVTYYNYLTLKAAYDWAKAGRSLSGGTFVEWVLSCMPEALKPLLNTKLNS